MSTEIKKEIQLEIAHVLFMDIVGYSKLLINEQRTLLDTLNQIVRSTDEFRTAEAAGRLIKIPTGDGMALVFYNSPEEPVECALDISRALKAHPNLPLRMGAHSGPVSGVIDVNERANVAGAGINMAQRVMDCGDAGHILLSKRVAEDLEQYEHWQPHLHELGECEVKHAVRVHIVNLYTDELGNPEPPEKFKQPRGKEKMGAGISRPSARPSQLKWVMIGAVVVVAVALAVTILMFTHRPSSKSVGTVASPPLSSAATAISEKSIAVLPFENLSRDPDNAYFATGIQDEILTRLSKIGALKVISRTSTQQYATRPGNLPDIARQLGVANILEGSVQKVGDQVHINVQLIRAATDEHLWAESYDRKLENIFGVQGEVATAVAEALKAKLTGAEQRALQQKPTNNAQAYDAYLHGIALWREGSFQARLNALKPLEEAVRLDPSFAAAWALLARVNAVLYINSATAERRAAAQRSLETALQVDRDLAEVQLAQGFYEYWVLRDYDRARMSFQQLQTKLPNNPDIPEALYMISATQGRWDESRIRTDEAVALNPRDRLLRIERAWVRHATRDFSAALRCYDEALTFWPDDQLLIAFKAQVYQALGDLDQAEELLKRIHPTGENSAGLGTICYQAILRRQYTSAINLTQKWLETTNSVLPITRLFSRMGLADLQRLSGDIASASTNYSEVRDELGQMLKDEPANEAWISQALADTYAGLGDRDRALQFADRAVNLSTAAKNFSLVPACEESRARIAARFGMKDVAIPALGHLLKTSYGSPLTPALLRLDPDFDALREDPRFQKLVTEAGPKP